MSGDEGSLARIAESVADGATVDWRSAEAAVRGPQRRLVRHLRLVDRISSVYRTLPAEPADGETPDPAEPGGERWGPLVLRESIGAGTSCEVFRAWDSGLHRDVALKLLHDDGPVTEARQRVLDEARRLARINHPHVVRVYGAEQYDNRVGLWMEWIRGESLDQLLSTRGPFSAREAALVGQDVCSALAAVHGAGLLHRDVKAQNVMRESGGRIVLMDFGTGEALRRSEGTSRFVGTPLYLAPEIFEGRSASVRTDLYSLGVLLFHLVTGEFPLPATSMEDLARAHARRDGRRLRDLRPDLPRDFVSVVEKALGRNPARRYASAGDMEAALGRAVDAEGRSVAAAVPAPAVRFRRRAFGAAAAMLLAVTVALLVWTRGLTDVPADPAVKRVAVVPLNDLSDKPAPQFAQALTDELITALGQRTSLTISSRAAVMQLADTGSPRAVSRELEVDAVIDGTLLVAEGPEGDRRVRVNLRLITAGSDTPLWARSFSGSLSDSLGMQADIANSIAEALHAPPAGEATRPKPAAGNEQATAAYLLGRYHMGHAGIAHTRLALDAFQRAIAMQPEHAASHAAMARCYVALGFFGDLPHAAARSRALSAATAALDLDPGLAEAHVALADMKFYYDRDWSGAEAAYLQVLALNRSLTSGRTQYARFLAALGRLDEALAQAIEASRDHSPEAIQTLGLIQHYRGEHAQALETLQRAGQADPNNGRVLVTMGRVFDSMGRLDDALAATGRAIQLAGENAVPWRLQQLYLRARAGRKEQVRAELDRTLSDLRARRLHVGSEHIAYVHFALGDDDRAFELLGQAVDGYEPGVLWLAIDPRLAGIRDDSRFGDLLVRIGLR